MPACGLKLIEFIALLVVRRVEEMCLPDTTRLSAGERGTISEKFG